MKYQARCFCFIILLVFCFALPALATVRNVQTYGATGNGTTNDASAINNAIAALVSGDELYFPCPSSAYLIASGLNTITVSNVTIDGQTGCSNGRVTMKSSGSGSTMMQIGTGATSAPVSITALAAELSTTIQGSWSNIGLAAGNYVLLEEKSDSQGGNTPGTCSVSGCRGEVVKIQSVSGTSAIVTTAVHQHYDPSCCSPTAVKMISPVTGINFHDLALDGALTAATGLLASGVADSTFTNVTVKNTTCNYGCYGIRGQLGWNVSWNNLTITGLTCSTSNTALSLYQQGNLNVNGVSISGGSGAVLGFIPYEEANGTFTNVTVDNSGHAGRPVKLNSSTYNTFNSLTAKNGSDPGGNGISVEYYSQHNTFNNCVVTNNGGVQIYMFGNGGGAQNQAVNGYNKFVNCTVQGNGTNYEVADSGASPYIEISGGTYTGSFSSDHVIDNEDSASTNMYVHDAIINGISAVGMYISSNNGCINNNTLGGSGTNIANGIYASGTGTLGSGNVLNGLASDLPPGTCGTAQLAPPTGLTATVQ